MTALGKLLRTTAFQLTLVYLLIFALFAASLLGYFALNTRRLINEPIVSTVDTEIAGLTDQYNQAGIRRLVLIVDVRSHRPGSSLYLVTTPTGEGLAGNVGSLEPGILDKSGWTETAYRRLEDPESTEHNALVHVTELPGGFRLLVGRDFLARCPLSCALGFSTRPGFLRNSFLRRAASQGFFLQPPLRVEPRCSHSLRRNFRFFPARCLLHRFSLCCRALLCRSCRLFLRHGALPRVFIRRAFRFTPCARLLNRRLLRLSARLCQRQCFLLLARTRQCRRFGLLVSPLPRRGFLQRPRFRGAALLRRCFRKPLCFRKLRGKLRSLTLSPRPRGSLLRARFLECPCLRRAALLRRRLRSLLRLRALRRQFRSLTLLLKS